MLAENGLKSRLRSHVSRVSMKDYVPSWEFNSYSYVGRPVVKKIRDVQTL
jgi:hypothetical protein